jgi:hypothetical protein
MTAEGERVIIELLKAILAEVQQPDEVMREQLAEIYSVMADTHSIEYARAADAVEREGADALPFTDNALDNVDGCVADDEPQPVRPRVAAALAKG